MTLNNKQRAFVEHYLTCWNATEAARRAGYSVKTAYAQGSRLLKDAEVEEAITGRLVELKAGADEVLVRLTAHSRGSMDDFIGSMDRIDIERARERGVMPLIKKIKQRTTTISKAEGEDIETHEVELELYDAQAATVQLGRYHKLFVDRQELTGKDSGPLEIGVTPIDYRAGLAALAPRPISDSDTPGEGEGAGDGPALGEDGLGRGDDAEHG